MVPVGVADHSIQNRVFGDSDPGFPRGLAASELVVQRLPYVRQRVARVAKRSLGTVVVDRDTGRPPPAVSRRCERVRTESESSVLRLLLVLSDLASLHDPQFAFNRSACKPGRERADRVDQAEVSKRYVNVTFAGHLRPVCYTGENVRFFDAGVLFEDLLDRPAAGQQVEHQRHPDAVSADARLAEADVGVYRYSGEDEPGPAGTISATSWASVRSSRNRSASEEVSLRIAKPSSSRSHGSRLAAVTGQSPR